MPNQSAMRKRILHCKLSLRFAHQVRENQSHPCQSVCYFPAKNWQLMAISLTVAILAENSKLMTKNILHFIWNDKNNLTLSQQNNRR